MRSTSDSDDRQRLFDALMVLERRVGMYTLSGTFGEVCAYLYGYDDGEGSHVLSSFHSWLVAREEVPPELAMPSVVLTSAFPDGPGRDPASLTPDENKVAISTLFTLLHQYRLEQPTNP